MKIAITGGKGGTGKSTVATALAIELAKENKVLLIDADVDCPDDDIVLSIDTKKVKDVENMVPNFDKNKCIKCGRCSQVCKENAIVFVKGKIPFLVPEQCTGCKACEIACPVNAISEKKQIIGKILSGKKENVTLVTGEMKPGIEESSLIVNAVKKYIEPKEKNYDYIIIDTAAGTHCPVIAALLDVDLGIAVTEPTPLGNHDLKLILELMKELKVKSKVILNRSDIADKKEVEKTVKNFGIKIIAEIPYSKKIQEAYSKGIPVKHKAIKEIIKEIKEIK
ncbi:ATP-binding protein [Candidatus Micrarchaeota archaeon]|nr:ATP-binding protein [Candidatus Micrarchaeota archaeon]